MNTLSRGTVPTLVLVVASGGFRRFKLQTARWGRSGVGWLVVFGFRARL